MSFGQYIEVGRMDEFSRLDSSVHRLDARVKALTTIIFIVVVMSFPRRELSALMPFFLYPVMLVSAGHIPPVYILRALLIASPFALAVGIFNPLMDRETAMMLGPYEISGGWLSLVSIALRFVLTVSAALTLVACTGIHRLCAGLEQMGLPRVFTVQLQLLYRYLFVIAAEGTRMTRAVEMRSAGRSALGLRTYASLAGNLLVRSMDRAQRVYQAMSARAFEGHVRVMRPGKVQWADAAFLVGWTVFFLAARRWNLSELIGGVATGEGL